jgi:imidazolonepropionase-like amidohydrolase
MILKGSFDPRAHREPRILVALVSTVLIMIPLLGAGAVRAEQVRRFENGLWYNGRIFEEKTMIAVDGVFVEGSSSLDYEVIDLEGGFIVPPYGDAHNHALASPQFEEESDRFITQGIFYAANPNSLLRWTDQAKLLADRKDTVDVRYSNGGITSSGGHPMQIYDGLAERDEEWSHEELDGQAYFTIDDLEQLEKRWPEILRGSPDFIKLYLESAEDHQARASDPAFYGKRGLDPTLVAPIVNRAHQAGLRVSAHVTSRFDFETAVTAGVDEIAHLPLEELSRKEADLAKTQGTVIVTTSLSHRPSPGIEDLDALHRKNLRLLIDAGVEIVLGTDSHQSVIDEVENLERMKILGNAQLLESLATETPKWIFPARKIGELREGFEASFLVLEANPLEDIGALRRIALRFKQSQLLEPSPDEALPGIGQTLAHSVMRDGVEKGLQEYHRLKREQPEAYDFSEAQLNALGYALIQHGKLDEAIRIFQLNAETFPDSFNAYDSLGEAHMRKGNRALAIEQYRRSLTLNPKNQNAAEKLRELGKSGD